MATRLIFLAALASLISMLPLQVHPATQADSAARIKESRLAQASLVGPLPGERFRTVYVRLGSNDDEGLLYEPLTPGVNSRIALLYSHPDGNTFNVMVGPEMANRGYRVLMVNHHGEDDSSAVYVAGLSRAVSYLRTLPGVQRVVVAGHSGGGHLIAFYANMAEHGPAGCQGPEKLYPCKSEEVTGLAKPDGVVLLDPTLGAFHQMSSVDPAVDGKTRNAALDMFATANGYDKAAQRATYSPEFTKRFYTAQAERNAQIVGNALQRLKLINEGNGRFTDDEPFVIPGMGVNAAGARLYQPDVSFLARTKSPHTLLKADGTQPDVIVDSVRSPSGLQPGAALGTLNAMTQNTTVRRFLANSAISTTPDFAITADDIAGVNWKSSINSTPGNAEGITVPTLVLSMSCHYLVVPGEIIYNHLASKDKTFAVVEGAVHNFTPCKPQYGDTVKRTFDYVDSWLAKEGRFAADAIPTQTEATATASPGLITRAEATRIAQSALEECARRKQPASVVVVDADGFQRTAFSDDNAKFIGLSTSRQKAASVLAFKVSSRVLQMRVQSDKQFADQFGKDDRYHFSAGGVPIYKDGKLVAVIAVGGARDIDEDCALAGLAALPWATTGQPGPSPSKKQ